MFLLCVYNRNKATEGYEKRWNELQQYFNSDTHPKEPGTSSDLTGPTPKVIALVFYCTVQSHVQ